jgi:hypothetical protein
MMAWAVLNARPTPALGERMKNKWWLAALFAIGCGAVPAQDDSDTDDLSSSTYSMEMVRANPGLLPGVRPAEGQRTNGRPRHVKRWTRSSVHRRIDESNWLYTANQLGQFLHLPEPAIANSDKGSATYSRQPGDLFDDGGQFEWTDIEQGAAGDCYFLAALSAVLFADKSGAAAKNIIVPHLQGGKVVAYDVTFFQASGRKVRIEVDPDLLRKPDGEIFYASSSQNQPGYEEWSTSLVEKAYAQWHRGFTAIANGGYAADGLFALTGKKTRSYKTSDSKAIAAIDAAARSGKAQVACTKSDKGKGSVAFPAGIYGDHCYTVAGIRRSGSQVFVTVRNPWGPGSASDSEPTEPPSADGTADGIFDVTQADFARLWDSVDIVP